MDVRTTSPLLDGSFSTTASMIRNDGLVNLGPILSSRIPNLIQNSKNPGFQKETGV